MEVIPLGPCYPAKMSDLGEKTTLQGVFVGVKLVAPVSDADFELHAMCLWVPEAGGKCSCSLRAFGIFYVCLFLNRSFKCLFRDCSLLCFF